MTTAMVLGSMFTIPRMTNSVMSVCFVEWESCSSEEEDDDSDSSWIDVHHSSDDEQCDVSMLCILMI